MYSLFEVKKVLSVSMPGGKRGVKIKLSAYSENKNNSIIALVCDNGYIVFRHVNTSLNTSVIRQINWFNDPEKEIKAFCFDSTGTWLLSATKDATLYIIPVFSVIGTDIKASIWKSDNLTEIKLSGQRALTTAIQWWKTRESEHIAIIGSELGEISFINLVNKKEVGGTYITTGILALDILYDESHDTTYLLITGSNQQQWRLLLEEKKSNYFWPFNTEFEVPSNSSRGQAIAERMSLTDEKNSDQRPHRLSKFESGTFLTPQCGDGRNLVSAYNSSSNLLQVLEGDLDQMHLFSYKVPPSCENIILSDKLIFVTSKSHLSDQHILKIVARKFAEISTENSKKKEAHNAEIQKFLFSGEILVMYKLAVQFPPSNSERNETDNLSLNQSKANPFNATTRQSLAELVKEAQCLDGVILVQKNCVWECRLRLPAEEVFLSLTATPSELPLAEKLGISLGLELHKLYDVAADAQLSRGQFAQAVHLYQLSKCPQLKRVAHFMGYGFLSELIAYIQVLFTTKGVEIVSADKCHFANIALHCFAHEVKQKLKDRHLINITFKKFLKENAYYDEEVAVKLLSEQGLCELLHYFARVRGQHGLMIETLLSTDGMKCTVDDATYSALSLSGYPIVLQLLNDEHYINCMTSLDLRQFLAAKPQLLNQHLQHLITLLPRMDVSLLYSVARLYDPSHPILKLCFKNLASSKINKRYWSLSSLATITNEMSDFNHKEEVATVDDVIKFFIFVLLMLCHKLDSPKFCLELLRKTRDDHLHNTPSLNKLSDSITDTELCVFDHSPISCGQAHVAYLYNDTLYTWGKSGSGRLGTDDMGIEYQTPLPVLTFLRLQLSVLAVSCGALHTLALTEFGTFAWGSSRYGQLGIGDVQQTSQPRIIEHLLTENIIKIQCGQYHSIALTASGRVLTWGWGIHGQLGHGNAEDLMFPKLIDSLKKKRIISISAGQGHTVILTKSGDVYTFGCGMFGQLGTGSVLKQSVPKHVNISERIKLIASGYFHVLAVSRKNKIHSWGCNPQALRLQAQNSRRARHHGSSSNYKSGSSHTSNPSLSNLQHRTANANGSIQQSHLLPNLVNISAIDDAIIEVSCGSHHSVLVTACGNVFSWGRNSEGQIGNGTRKEQKTPTLVTSLKDKKIVHASCGADFTIAVESNGKLYGWGQNDGGQVGQKPSLEPNSKYNSGSSSGRVITIRTNRRMITITQPCRQSILRPVEIPISFYDVKNPGIFDSGSFESDYPVVKLLSNKVLGYGTMRNDFDLSKLDKPSYGPYALHAALEAFHIQCDSSILLNHCLNFGNFQAAAKLSDLENMHDKALEYQLDALSSNSNSCVNTEVTLYIVNFYSNFLQPENIVSNQKFLCHVIRFWIKNSLPVADLEHLFESHNHIFTYPLGLIMFNDQCPGLDSPTHSQFLNLLSTKFCLKEMDGVFKQVQQGYHLLNVLEKMDILSDTTDRLNKLQVSDAFNWDDTISQNHLWLDIMHNLQAAIVSNSAINLSSNDIDLLSKSLLSEKFYMQSFNNLSTVNRSISNGSDAVIFSCGHHHTIPAFQTNVMATLKESLQTLFYAVPETFKLLLTDYHENIITAACPKCVIAEMSNEL